jgi:hypothetical protein
MGSRENLELFFGFMRFPGDASSGDHRHPAHVQREDYISRVAMPVIFEIA